MLTLPLCREELDEPLCRVELELELLCREEEETEEDDVALLREDELPERRELWAERSIPLSDSMRAIAVTAIVEKCRIFFMTNNFKRLLV